MSSVWIFRKIRLGVHAKAADALIRDLFPQLRQHPAVQQWFFIRYADETDGFHLRFRLRVAAAEQITVQQWLDSKLATWLPKVPQLAATEPGRQPLAGSVPVYQYQDFTPAVVVADYEPELEKFGAGESLEIAHRWFARSSELTLQILQLDKLYPGVRNALAYWLTQAVCEVFQPKPEPAKFLQQYSYTWLPRNLVQVNNFRKQFFRDALALLDRQLPLLPQLTDWPAEADSIRQQWYGCLQLTLQQLKAQGLSQSFIQQQGWQCIHLMNNRLGISPFEESYLATLLEAWYREEARYVA